MLVNQIERTKGGEKEGIRQERELAELEAFLEKSKRWHSEPIQQGYSEKIAGAQLRVLSPDEKGLERVLNEIKSDDSKAVSVISDVSKPSDAKNSVEKALNEFGQLDISCNNAGVGGEAKMIGELDPEDWNSVVSINLNGVFYGMRYQIPAMLKNGGGSIITPRPFIHST